MTFSWRTVALAILLSTASPAAIVYQMDRVVGTQNIRGTLTTDGTTGILSAGHFTAWDLRIFDGNTQVGHITNTVGPLILVSGSALSATPEHLVFDFSRLAANYFLLQETVSFKYWCVETSGCAGTSPQETLSATGVLTEARTGSVVLASSVPEPATAALAAGALILAALGGRRNLRQR
jgi:hypothetical protein